MRAKTLIERSLHHPPPETRRIAGAPGVSPRCLGRLFEAEQMSLTRPVWGLRLERSCDQLLDPACAARSIGDMAMRWGFDDLAHFSPASRSGLEGSPRKGRRALALDGPA